MCLEIFENRIKNKIITCNKYVFEAVIFDEITVYYHDFIFEVI